LHRCLITFGIFKGEFNFVAQVGDGVAVNDSPGFKELVVEHLGQAVVSAYLRLRLAVHPAENKEICQYKTSEHKTKQHSAVQHSTKQCGTKLCNSLVQYSSVLCSTMPYSTE
jgi:hypothetical protein